MRHLGKVISLNSVELHSTGRPVRPRHIASLPSLYIAISRCVEPRCTAAVYEWAIDPATAPDAITPQPEAGPDVQITYVPERRNEPAAPEAAASASLRVAVEPHIAVAAQPQNTFCGRACRRTRRASLDSDGDEERDTAQLELDGATTEGDAEKALPSDGAESEGQEPISEDDDAAPTVDGGTHDDAADVQQLTAIAQRLIAQCQARGQRAQRGRLKGMSAPNSPQML
eukprot:357398-Chlamydomonas_euryale.AAC.2